MDVVTLAVFCLVSFLLGGLFMSWMDAHRCRSCPLVQERMEQRLSRIMETTHRYDPGLSSEPGALSEGIVRER